MTWDGFELLTPEELDRILCAVSLATHMLHLGPFHIVKAAKEMICNWVHAMMPDCLWERWHTAICLPESKPIYFQLSLLVRL